METVEFNIHLEIRDNLYKQDVAIAPALDEETIEEIVQVLRRRLLKLALKRKGYVVVAFGPEG